MEKKITIKEQFVEVKAILEKEGRDDLVKFVEGRIALLDKKAENKKPTKEQEANVALMNTIASVMTTEGKTVSEIIKLSDDLKDLSNQKVSSMLRKMVEDGRVVKDTEGKKSLFRLA